ncbi:MAG: hypothetical protein V7608_5229, partial [Hyphomicrobiales bacterium]
MSKNTITRRHLVGSTGIGLAGAVASTAPSLAEGNQTMAAQPLQD